jgi:hypothetical protein
VERERRRDEEHRRTLGGQRPVEPREPEVVADAQPERREVGVDGREPLARGDVVGFGVFDAAVDVEQVDLAVGVEEPAVGSDQRRGVVHAAVESSCTTETENRVIPTRSRDGG